MQSEAWSEEMERDRFDRQHARAEPGTLDPYFIRFLKLVPVEAVAPFPFLMNYASALAPADGSPRYAVYVVAWVLLLVLVAMRWKAAWQPVEETRWQSVKQLRPSAVLIPAFTFVIWVHVIGGDFGTEALLNSMASPIGISSAISSFPEIKNFTFNLMLIVWSFGAPALFRQATRTSPGVADSYTDRLVKLTPSEAIIVLPLLMDICMRLAPSDDFSRLAIYAVAWVLLSIVFVMRWRMWSGTGWGVQWGAVLIPAVAFFIWVHVMGGDFGFEVFIYLEAATKTQTHELKTFVSNTALMAWLTLAPVVYRGFVGRRPANARTSDIASRGAYSFERGRWQAWRRRAWTATKVSSAAMAVVCPVVYGLALIALDDLERLPLTSLAGTTSGGITVAADRSGSAGMWRDNHRVAALAGHGAALASADLIHGGGTLLSTAYDGSVRIDRTGPSAILHTATLPQLSAALYDRLWRPYGAPVAQQALWLASQVVPLHIPETRKGRRGRVFKDCPECPEMVEIEPGVVLTGSPLSDLQRGWDEGPRQLVTIAQPFAVGRFEVTFAEWDACVAAGGCGGHRPGDEGWGRERRPVINVSWADAKAYVEWLNSKVASKPYRLLSEAEWEYVARAGATSRYAWGDEIGKTNANCAGCGSQWDERQSAPVGSFAPNAFGLHDLSGNVWEWVEDCFVDSLSGQPVNGTARTQSDGTCSYRVLRSGSMFDRPDDLRAARRLGLSPGNRELILGFRLARTITP